MFFTILAQPKNSHLSHNSVTTDIRNPNYKARSEEQKVKKGYRPKSTRRVRRL